MGLTLFWLDTLTHNLSSLHPHIVTTLWILQNVLISVRELKASQPASQHYLSLFLSLFLYSVSLPANLFLKKIYLFLSYVHLSFPWLWGSWITDRCELPCRCWVLNLNYLCSPTWNISLYSLAWKTFRVHSAPWVNVLCFLLLYI